jgi:hypothetical protein
MPQDDSRSRSHAATAVALARRLGDPRGLTTALATWVLVTWGPGDPDARLSAIDEVIRLGDGLAWTDVVVEAHNWRAATLLQLGRSEDAARATAPVHQWARQTGRPFFIALAAMRHVAGLLDAGRCDDAEIALSNPPPGAHASPNFSEAAAAQLFLLRLAQGRVGELQPLVESLLDQGPAPFAWRAAHVLILAVTGDHRARGFLRDQVHALRRAPRDWLWLAAVTLLADACIAVADGECAAPIEDALRPHCGQTVVVAHGIATLGAVASRLDSLRVLRTNYRVDHKNFARVA